MHVKLYVSLAVSDLLSLLKSYHDSVYRLRNWQPSIPTS